ncbi:interferon-stimulated 20 kDa exonuclease-like 2 [Mytilus trossulus]|uniref:interferon-stimulated 20 kDa exonuclease-like 2 n=1 Tax=Mytilus trossulus TaxID=6551 RepID=UPI0030070D3A
MLYDSGLDEDDIETLPDTLNKSEKHEKCNMLKMNVNGKNMMNGVKDEFIYDLNDHEENEELKGNTEKGPSKRKLISLLEPDNIHKRLKKSKKLNSRLERLLKIKNRRNVIPSDPKLSPLYTEKEMKWTSFEDDKDIKSHENDLDTNSTHAHSVIRRVHIKSESMEYCTECKKLCKKCACTVQKSDVAKCHNQINDMKINVVSLSVNSTLNSIPTEDRIVAMDCEFVGVHPKNKSALGRCSVVDFYGNVLYDKFVKPDEPIFSYRTQWSGIRKKNLKNAIPFATAHQQIWNLLLGKIIVGHALFNDFKVMKIQYTGKHVRDTASYKPLRALANLSENTAPKLKNLSQILLGRTIQTKEHCSVEDSMATLDLYKLVSTEWEKSILDKEIRRQTNDNKDILDNKEEETCDNNCDSKSYLSDEFWPQYLFPSN